MTEKCCRVATSLGKDFLEKKGLNGLPSSGWTLQAMKKLKPDLIFKKIKNKIKKDFPVRR